MRVACPRCVSLAFFCYLIPQPATALDLSAGYFVTCTAWLQERENLRAFLRKGGEMPTGTRAPSQWLLDFLRAVGLACWIASRVRPRLGGSL